MISIRIIHINLPSGKTRKMTAVELNDQKEKLVRILKDRKITANVSVKGNKINITSMSKPNHSKQNPMTMTQRDKLGSQLGEYYRRYLPNVVLIIKID